ncbi:MULTISPECIES: FKBP-type peptidyl-prolyl cis-trans isomerase [Streptomyces]|uniref:FKBP-type peptidyl-prolyl cis-trans isomerase n=1 Tax=Streptomyces sp. SYP-A7185 TaxID=3040076 RepID=UPI0038F7DB84
MSIEKPEIDFPDGPVPTDLQIVDIWEGDGAEAKAGDTVQVHYVGVSFSTGEEFDASWNRGNPLAFQLGAGQVIAGWDQGVQGMKVGGRRKLTIPAHLAYGERGAGGGAIAPGETLIFVCDLVAV